MHICVTYTHDLTGKQQTSMMHENEIVKMKRIKKEGLEQIVLLFRLSETHSVTSINHLPLAPMTNVATESWFVLLAFCWILFLLQMVTNSAFSNDHWKMGRC
ncbi:hypothetical protein PIB30_063005 [Stylosanthes scabra]|uniref:Uncharacterized protein n=1 Tax=Stylosanthes scabra TaxID=79078 RepID=A0ABU6ULV6_9FABA|nr:hypothetical protein [Stylosanthes scabra]